MTTKLEVSPRTILFLILIMVGLWLIVQIRDILALIFIAFILMSALRPSVDRLEKLHLPRFLAIIIMYIIIISAIAGFGTVVVPPLVSESIRLARDLPIYIAQVVPLLNIGADTLIQQIAPLGQNVVRVTVGLFSNLITIFTIAVFTFYFSLERNNLQHFLSVFIGEEASPKIMVIVRNVEQRLGAWVRGQLTLAFIIGLASYVGLTFLGVNYALPLALIAGILEMVPIIGPIISAVPAVLVAVTISPGLALAVVALYFVIQQLENNLLVPTIMLRTVGLPPLASLLALMIGGRLGGTLGIILAIPTFLVIQTVVQELLRKEAPTAR